MKTIEQLLQFKSLQLLKGDPHHLITQLDYDSRKVKKGSLYFAYEGQHSDGHHYIKQAIEKGAVAVVLQKTEYLQKDDDICYLQSSNVKKSMAEIADFFYDHPSQKLVCVGITGTNGKTTCSYLIESILNCANLDCAVSGTIEQRFKDFKKESTHTTPEAPDLQSFIHQIHTKSAKALVLEISSHAIELFRCHHLHLDAAVFTNLSVDHLDFHQNLESYFKSKSKLFSEILSKSSKAKASSIINIDDEFGERLAKSIPHHLWTFSKHQAHASLYCTQAHFDILGIKANLAGQAGEFKIESSLLGTHNLENILAAVAVALSLDIPIEKIQQGIKNVSHIPGRLERIENKKGIHIFVDYAHSPDAIARVLQCLKSLKTNENNKLKIVFGCGGDRDKSKRPMMAEQAAQIADEAMISSDNPRTENAKQIIDDILQGFKNTPALFKYEVEEDRKKAIAKAIDSCKAGDILLIAGKGHENYQIIGKEKFHFDDREIARSYSLL